MRRPDGARSLFRLPGRRIPAGLRLALHYLRGDCRCGDPTESGDAGYEAWGVLEEEEGDRGDGIVKGPKLKIVPVDFDEAKAFVRKLHRHHVPPVGHKFSLGVADEHMTIRGVAIIGRPVSRNLDDGWTLEVTRVATDGCKNACSALYSAAWRTARGMGYQKLITYTLPEEGGASLRGSGWMVVGQTQGGSWSRTGRPRID